MADERKPFKVPGSKGITVPVGNTAQRPASPDEGVFRYNTDSSSFEGYVGAAWSGIGGAGTSTWVRDQFTGNGSNTQFTLSQQPSSEDNLIVFEEGVFQDQDAYSISGNNIVFASAPTNLNTIVVYTVRAAVSGSNLNRDAYTANGTQTAFGMTISPIDENNTQVFLDGVYQHKDGYSVSGNTLTFSAAPSNGTEVEIMTFTQTTINQPGANTVGATALKPELGNTGVTVNTSGIFIGQDVGITSNVTFHTVTANVSGDVTGNVSGDVTGNVSGNLTGNVTGDVTGNVTGDVAGNVTGHIVANSIVAAGHIIPNANVTYDLGNTTNAFRDLYLSGSTIKLGSQTLSSNATHISIGTAELSSSNGMLYARQEDIDTAVANLVASAPGTLDTLNELASALGNDASFSTTVTNSLALKAPSADPSFTGNATFDSTTLFVDGTNNRVGIGTSGPSSILHLVESSGPVLRMVRTSNRFDIEADTNAMGFVSRDSTDATAYFSGFGKIGIGTTSPNGILDVNPAGGPSANNWVNIRNNIGGTNPPDSPGLFVGWNKTNGGGETIIGAGYGSLGSYAPRLDFALYNGTTYTTAMTIKSDASVGIGTTDPTGAKLHVVGGVKATDLIAHDSSGINLQTDEGTKRLIVDDAGYVVITDDVTYTANAPTHRGSLVLAGASGFPNYGGLEFHTSSGGGAGYGTRIVSSDATLGFGRRFNATGWTESMRIDNNGYIGVGDGQAPYSQLHLTGDITMGSGSNARPALKITRWGYSSGYRALMIGSTSTSYTTGNTGSVSISFNYDPSVNPNGSFVGDGREIIFRNGTKFVTPNSGNTLWNLNNIVLQDGSVGIGTDTPDSLLDVNGVINIRSNPVIDSDGTSHYLKTPSGGAMYFYHGTTNMMYYSSSALLPGADDARDLGSTSLRWRNVYTTDLHLSNEGKSGGNEVDGTTGNWTIQEGKDHLYIINNKNGKKYRFALEEIE